MNEKPNTISGKSFRLYDFNVYDGLSKADKKEGAYFDPYKDNKHFMIQAFGIDKDGKTASILINGFKPFFYIMVKNNWNNQQKSEFIVHLRKKLGNYYEESILNSELIKKQKLYGFDNKKLHTFIKISFKNNGAYNRAKNLFYNIEYKHVYNKVLKSDGYEYEDDNGEKTNCYLYEADIPPLLKLFHIKEFSPSGWILLPNSKREKVTKKTTHCFYEYEINYKDIVSQSYKEDSVKYNICSFDIEASSSHGDFPVPIKKYKKLATNILENYHNLNIENKETYDKNILKQEIMTAFGYDNLSYIAIVYPKIKSHTYIQIENLVSNLLNYIPEKNDKEIEDDDNEDIDNIDNDNIKDDEEENDDLNTGEEGSKNNNGDLEQVVKYYGKKKVKSYKVKDANIVDLIKDEKCEYSTKLKVLTKAFEENGFPELEGDIVTFIGLTFILYGDKNPYKRVIIVKGGCKIPDKYLQWTRDNNVTVLERKTEKEVLLTFTKLFQRENPHIVTGYNINGFDFDFMFKRSQELECEKEFLKLSRNKDDTCWEKDWKTGEHDIASNKIILASGEYNLKFINMPGRIIIDMCTVFRREFTLSSFKLDYVSSYFISDSVKKVEHDETEDLWTKVYSKNLTGLNVGSYIKFEEIAHSSSAYKKGKKFEVIDINRDEGSFVIDSCEKELDLETYKINWGLAKDDVTPQEIFSLSNGSDEDRWTVGKYCIADCDNVIWLLLKVDVITDKVEMSKLCDVPLSFLLQRGQGIKLTSYVSKKCGEKNTLMPVNEKKMNDTGYEGAHVFTPKKGLYLEDPVACTDYSSLYPSSMISENISHDSKVWTKEYDLSDNLIHSTGETDEQGNYIYDNLDGYKYVDVKYDVYDYIRKTAKAAAQKTVVGYKICRYAQFPDGTKAIMPSILEELLASRKATRKMIPKQTDEFMKNVLDKRQLSIKVTANSLYGQCGAKTSTFYEKDIAASTTATGRKLLFYGRSIIEECYDDQEIILSDGRKVLTKAECVYGDTDSVFFKFNLRDAETGEKIINHEALVYTIELAKQAGELASKFLKGPHDLEYEKTFLPWALLSKKRYAGMLYEDDPNKGKFKHMGLVLKRRDNADIVKDIYGTTINILMQEKSLAKSITYVDNCLQDIIAEKYPIEKLLVTKALRGYYKNPKQIAHKVLAERIGMRDAGNKPSAGDRMYYAYIKNPDKKALQGDKIETPDYIKENNIPIDYPHYISNQIMKPLLQLFALELENIKEFKKKRGVTLQSWKSEIEKLREKWPEPEKFEKKLEELRCKEVKSLIFDKYLK